MAHKKQLIKTYFDGECFMVYSKKINIHGFGLTRNIHGFGLTIEEAKKDLLDFWHYVKFQYNKDKINHFKSFPNVSSFTIKE